MSHVKKAVRAKALKDVDEYIAKAPRVAQEKLSMMRTIVRAAAPDAKGVISYNMPYYKFHGPLVGFAACQPLRRLS